MFSEILKAFVILFVIVDPFVSIPIFIALTRKENEARRRKDIMLAVSVAGALLVAFLFIGTFILDVFKIDFNSFQIAGGVILLLLGIQTVLGIDLIKTDKKKAVGIIIGTPLLTGPGALTTIIILSKSYSWLILLVAIFLVLIVTWLLLRYSHFIQRLVGEDVIEIMSRVMGLLLAAMAIQFIKEGILGIIKLF